MRKLFNKVEGLERYTAHTEKILILLWFLFPIIWTTRFSRSYLEFVLIISPVLIFSTFGNGWLRDINFKKVVMLVFGCFFIVSILSQLSTIEISRGIDSIRSFHIKLLFFIFTFMFLFRHIKNRIIFMTGCSVALFILVFFGYYELIWGSEALLWERHEAWSDAISPFSYHKNRYGMYLALLLPICFSLGFYKLIKGGREFLKGIIWVILAVLTIPILNLSLSRTAQVAGLVGVVLVIGTLIVCLTTKKFAESKSISPKKLMVAIFCLLLLFLFIGISLSYSGSLARWQRFLESPERDALSGRYSRLWPAIIEQASERLWLGYDMSSETAKDVLGTRLFNEHSKYLYILFKSGLLSLIMFVLFNIFVFFFGLKKIYQLRFSQELFPFVGFFAAYVGTVVVGGLATEPTHYFLEINFALILALLTLKYDNYDINDMSESSDLRVLLFSKSKRTTMATEHFRKAFERHPSVGCFYYLNYRRLKRLFPEGFKKIVEVIISFFKPDITVVSNYDVQLDWIKKAQEYGHTACVFHDYQEPLNEKTVRIAKEVDRFYLANEKQIPEFEKKGVKPELLFRGCSLENHYPMNFLIRNCWKSDLTFIGKPRDGLRNKLIIDLFELLHIDFKLWGGDWGEIGLCSELENVYASQYRKICFGSKIMLGINDGASSRTLKEAARLRKYNSNRTRVTLGCGGFLLTNYNEGLEEIFSPGVHLDFYRSKDELIDKIKFYLDKPKLRRKIASQGSELVRNNMTFDHFANEVIRRRSLK